MKTAHDLVAEAKSCTQEIALKDAEQAIRQADVLIDVREADEFAAGHLAGAVLMPRGLLEFKAREPISIDEVESVDAILKRFKTF